MCFPGSPQTYHAVFLRPVTCRDAYLQTKDTPTHSRKHRETRTLHFWVRGTLSVSEHVGERMCPYDCVPFALPFVLSLISICSLCCLVYSRYRGTEKHSETHTCSLRNRLTDTETSVYSPIHTSTVLCQGEDPSSPGYTPITSTRQAGCRHVPGMMTSPPSAVLEPNTSSSPRTRI